MGFLTTIFRKIFLLLSLAALYILTGCYAPRYTEVDILFPAEKDLPDEINKVAMVNRSYLPLKERKKSGIYYENNQYKRDKNYQDSIVSDNALYSFAYHVNVAPRLNVTENDSIIRKNINEYEFLEPMKPDNVSKICNETDADAVVALEAFHSFDSLGYYTSGFEVVGVRATSLFTLWRTYSPKIQSPIDKLFDQDTVWFEGVGYSTSNAQRNLPSRKEALQEASYQAGKKYAQQISPHWKTIERLYFEYYNKPMSKATEFAEDSQWKKAAAIWRKIAKEGSRTKHAIAAFNMAVASEMLGQLDLAGYWINEAIKKKSNASIFKNYKATIANRIERQEEINRQMNIRD